MDDAGMFIGKKTGAQSGTDFAGTRDPVHSTSSASMTAQRSQQKAEQSASFAGVLSSSPLQQEEISQPQLSHAELFEVARYRDAMSKVAEPQASIAHQVEIKVGTTEAPEKAAPRTSQASETKKQTLEHSMARVTHLLSEERPLLERDLRLQLQGRLSQVQELVHMMRSSLSSTPLIGGFLETCFTVVDKVITKAQEFLRRSDEIQFELLMERQAKEIVAHFTAERRSEAIFHLAAIQHDLDEEDTPLLLVKNTPDQNAKKIAEAARRLLDDILQEYERIELEKKKHEAEEDLKKEAGETLEQKIAKVFPGAGHDPRVAQLISAEISGIFQDYSDFDIRCMVEQILRVLEGDAKKIEEVC